MNDSKEFQEEIKTINADKQLELDIEKQRTKTEKAKQGTGKTIAKIIGATIFSIILLIVVTWVITLFLPNNAKAAFEIVKSLFS